MLLAVDHWVSTCFAWRNVGGSRNSCVNFSSPAAVVVVPVSATRRNVLHSSSLTAEDNPTWLLLCLCPLGLLARAHLAAVCLSYQSGYLTSPASPQD